MQRLLVSLAILAVACTSPSKVGLTGRDGPSTFVITVIDGPQTMKAGESSLLRVGVERILGNTEEIGSVRFSVAGAPSGVVLTGFLGSTEREVTLALVTSTTSPVGTHTLTILGEADGRTSTVTYTLQIAQAAQNVPGTDFALAVDQPSLTLAPGASGSVGITISRGSELDGAVALSVSGLPTDVTAVFTPSLASGTSATLTISAGASAAVATTALVVTGEHPNAVHTQTLSLIVASMTVQAPSNLVYTTNPATYLQGTAITPNTVASVMGSPVMSYGAVALPPGLSLDTLTGTISGTPSTVSGATAYTVRATNSAGFTDATLSITINSGVVAPTGVVYATNPATYTRSQAITPNTVVSFGGGAPTGFTAPSGLPAGLAINASNGTITGTPSVSGPATNYPIRASNSAGFADTLLNLTITDAIVAPSNLVYTKNPVIYTVNLPITPNIVQSVSGSTPTYTSLGLPPGLTVDGSSGTISGTPTVIAAATSFTLRATNAAGFTDAFVNIEIHAPCAQTCAPVVPTGWTGPLAVAETAPGSAPSCSGTFNQSEWTGGTTPTGAAASCGCTCTPIRNACNYVLEIHNATNCGSSAAGYTYMSDGVYCGGYSAFQPVSYRVLLRGTAGGADASNRCAKDESQSVPSSSYTQDMVACSASSLTTVGCADDRACVTSPGGAFIPKLCIGSTTQTVCPAGYTVPHDYFRSKVDDRGCNACNCTNNGVSCSGGTYNLYDSPGACGGGAFKHAVAVNDCIDPVTEGISSILAVTYVPTSPAGTCSVDPGGGTSTGGVSGGLPLKVCCTP